MADAYKCDICKIYKDGIPKPTGKYSIFDMDKKASEPLHLCPTCQAKFDRLFNGKPRRKKKPGRPKKKVGRPRKQAETPVKKKRGRPKKEKAKEKPKKLITNEKSKISPDARSIRMKFISKRRSELKKQGYNAKETWKMASDEYMQMKNGNGSITKNNNKSGSSRCKSCSEPIPKDDEYCPTCNMVHNEDMEATDAT
jgi:hypothetical protein